MKYVIIQISTRKTHLEKKKSTVVRVRVMKKCAGGWGAGGGQIYTSTLSLTSALQGRKISISIQQRRSGRFGKEKTPCLCRNESRTNQPIT
jgi:hypothetical protein